MRILYIYREKEKNEHSIEAVFDTVAAEMEKFGHEVHKWYKPVSWEQCLKDIRRLRKEKYDVYHITGDVNYLWVLFPWSKTTMTVHDIGFYKNNPLNVVRMFLVVMIYLASWGLKRFTCVSDLTRNDLVNLLHIRGKKITTITNPLSLPVKRKDKVFNKDCPTILQIGTGWHKNLEGLIEASKGIPCKLDIVGKPDEADIQKMKVYGINYTTSHHIPVEEIVRKYEECDILYFVSRSEGFGMPIIEAQTVGRVVLTTDTEPTKTVANGAAMLFSSEEHLAIHNGILKAINDDRYRDSLIKMGYVNAANYTPDRIASLYEDFYKSVFKL